MSAVEAGRGVRPLLRQAARSFVERECSLEVVSHMEATGYPAELWKRMVTMGWAGLLLPAEAGGGGLGVGEMALIVEELGAAGMHSPLFACAVEAGPLMAALGSDAQRRTWLPRIASGAIVSVARLEASGQDPDGVATVAEPAGGGFVMRGAKTLVPYAETAELYVCLARRETPAGDLAWFLVPADRPGLTVTPQATSDGEPHAAVRFDGVGVVAEEVLGAGARSGWAGWEAIGDQAAALKCVELVGIGRRALELTVAFVKSRIAFGRPIGSFQAVQHHCVDMYRQLEAARVLTEQAIANLERGPAPREVSLAKVKAGEAIPAVLRLAQQVHGGVGFYAEYPLERLYRRALTAQAAYGSVLAHRARLAGRLRQDPPAFRRESAHELPIPR